VEVGREFGRVLGVVWGGYLTSANQENAKRDKRELQSRFQVRGGEKKTQPVAPGIEGKKLQPKG